MGDQQAVKAGFGETAAQLAYAAKVVHFLRITGQEFCDRLSNGISAPSNKALFGSRLYSYWLFQQYIVA